MIENKFESSTAPDHLPDRLVAGSLWQWKNTGIRNAYDPANNNLTLVFTFVSLDNESADAITIAADPGTFLFTAQSAETAPFMANAGEWRWTATVTDTDTSNTAVAAEGYVLVEDTSAVPHVYSVLSAIRKVIAGTATKEQMAMQVGDRSLTRRKPSELLELQGQYERRWAEEKARAKRSQGRTGRKDVRWRLPGA